MEAKIRMYAALAAELYPKSELGAAYKTSITNERSVK